MLSTSPKSLFTYILYLPDAFFSSLFFSFLFFLVFLFFEVPLLTAAPPAISAPKPPTAAASGSEVSPPSKISSIMAVP